MKLLCLLATLLSAQAQYDLNFQAYTDVNGKEVKYKKGDYITAMDGGKVKVRAFLSNGRETKGAMIFDSANPSGGDWDLGTPNEAHGGPGRAKDGDFGVKTNKEALGNLLIVPERDEPHNPDDAVKGTIIFEFVGGARVLEDAVLVDDEEGTTFIAEYADGSAPKEITMGRAGDNSVETVTFQKTRASTNRSRDSLFALVDLVLLRSLE